MASREHVERAPDDAGGVLYHALAGPVAYLECDDCHTPFVLRRGIAIPSGRSVWTWRRDCKHKSAGYNVVAETAPPPVSTRVQVT